MKFRYLYLVLTLAFILITGTWLARTQLAEIALTSLMHDAGLSDITTHIQGLDISQTHLSHLDFTLVNEKDIFMLEAHDVHLNYSLDQLQQGRVDSLSIRSLVLHYKSNPDRKTDTPVMRGALEPQKIVVAFRRALSEYVFFNTLSIDRVTLQDELFLALKGKQLQLSSKNDNGILSVSISLFNESEGENSKQLRQLLITQTKDDSFIADLKFLDDTLPIATKLEIKINDKQVTGKYSINPPQLLYWLKPVFNLNDIGELQKLNGLVDFNFESTEKIISTITVNADELVVNPYTVKDVDIKLIFSNSTTNPHQHTSILKGSYFNSTRISDGNLSLVNKPINISGELTSSGDSWNYKGEARSELFSATFQSQTLPLKDISVSLIASAAEVNAKGIFSLVNLPGLFEFSVNHRLTEKAGGVTVTSSEPIDLSDKNSNLSQIINKWSYPFDLVIGNINLQSRANWSKKKDLKFVTKITLNNTGGNYGEVLFSGLNFEHELEILPKLRSVGNSNIELDQLDSGIVANNIKIDFSLETTNKGSLPIFNIHKLYGEIFDGTIESDNFMFDLNQQNNSFVIKANDIDLAKVVETQQFEDIEVTGKLNGIIPVEINEQGISIEDGSFINNVRSGIIRYNPVAGTDQLRQNPLTGIALDTLKDFRYSDLSAGVNFTPEGKLTVNLQLKGTSPELDTDRPVHLNINTEQDLFALLKSLRFAEGISESIDKRVRQQYEKNRN